MAGNDARPQMFGVTVSKTDLEIVAQANHDSFLSRCLPFMTVTSAATHYLVKTGKLTANARFGSLPKVAFAAYFGFIFGKISYKNVLQEKLKADPNSLLGRSIREAEGLEVLEPTDPEVIQILKEKAAGGSSTGSTDSAAVAAAVAGAGVAGAAAVAGAAGTDAQLSGYDELRRQNREKAAAPPNVLAPPPNVLAPPLPDMDEEVPAEERPMNKRMPVPKRNKYGDIIED